MMNAKIAEAALTYYDLPPAQLTFLGQSQNTKFRVETSSGDRFLLRLHLGIEAASDRSHDAWREPSAILTFPTIFLKGKSGVDIAA
jgi:hypothetical protein